MAPHTGRGAPRLRTWPSTFPYLHHWPTCTNTNTTCSQFADDTALITSTPSLQTTEQLQEAVSSAGRWLKDWHLLVNVETTVTVVFHHDNRPPAQLPTIYLDEQLLTVARKQRHLGITFQHDLRWTEHTNAILNKSLTSLKNILRRRNSLNSSALTYLYCTYIRPKLEYACIALSPYPRTPWTNSNAFNAKLPGYVFAYHSTPLLTTHTSINLVFLHSTVVGISNTSFLHTPYITVMLLPTFCSWTSLHPPHLTTLYVIDDPTIYLAPVLTVTKTPLYINHFTSLTHCLKISKTHVIAPSLNSKSMTSL